MKLQFGWREADIARRESGIVSWLGYREHMPGSHIARLFSEGATERFKGPVDLLTELALSKLTERDVIRPTVITAGGMGFQSFNLTDKSAAVNIDPATVELAPRETALLSVMHYRRDALLTPEDFDPYFGEPTPDSWQTTACLGHLAHLGIIQAGEGNPPAYVLPHSA